MDIQIERVGLEDISPALLGDLERLYSLAFFNSHMFERLLEDLREEPDVFQLFLAKGSAGAGEILGARVIELKPHGEFDYRGHLPFHGKRFCISPSARGLGLGRSMIEAGKAFCFEELGAKAIFGESNEVAALDLHGRAGALLSRASIETLSSRNSPSENLEFFREFLTNPKFRHFRFPVGSGVRFVYCKDAATAGEFAAAAHLPLRQLLDAASAPSR
jgi:GNAT superfamily N-acetyltransferase